MIEDAWGQLRQAGEGLRERKKRLTRQRISDVATRLFIERGFDNVRIAEIAEIVGVSEKTVYNYFPTKESLVFDRSDEQLETVAAAVRDRPRGMSPTVAFAGGLKQDLRPMVTAIDGVGADWVRGFSEMVRTTPTLQSAWGEHRHRAVERLTEILGEELGVDPREAEVLTAARALVSLMELFFDSQFRHVDAGLVGEALTAAVEADLDRGVRLLDTGFWSLHLMVEGRRTKEQLKDAALVAEQARQQVMAALRDAKRAWREIRAEAKAAAQEARNGARDARAGARAAAHDARADARRVAQADGRGVARADARGAGRELNSGQAPGAHSAHDRRT